MRQGGGHAKGSNFEREVAKRLSLWVSVGRRDDLFWRTAMSGGRATLQGRKGKVTIAQVGDIGAIDSDGEHFLRHVVIECKFRADLDITAGLLTNRGRLFKYWNEVCAEADRVGRAPFLIARQNRQPALVLVPMETASELDILYDVILRIYGWDKVPVVFLFDDLVPPVASYAKKGKLRQSRRT